MWSGCAKNDLVVSVPPVNRVAYRDRKAARAVHSKPIASNTVPEMLSETPISQLSQSFVPFGERML